MNNPTWTYLALDLLGYGLGVGSGLGMEVGWGGVKCEPNGLRGVRAAQVWWRWVSI